MSKPSIEHLLDQLANASDLLSRAAGLVASAGQATKFISSDADYNKVAHLQDNILAIQGQLTEMHAKIVDEMKRWHETFCADPWEKPSA